MNFRRIPFQFSTTDPVKRQAELQKRFGLPAKQDNMYVDVINPGSMGTGSTTGSSSPRLQHRVPIFVEGISEPVKPSVDSQNNVDVGRKPHVRVVPIEIEGVDSTSKRHRNISGPSPEMEDKPRQNGFWPPWSSVTSLKRTAPVPTAKATSEPKVFNIPINIEKDNTNKNVKPPVSVQQEKSTPLPTKAGRNSVSDPPQKSTPLPQESSPKSNGCNVSKPRNPATEKNSPEQISMKKIENILKKFKEYQLEAEKFSDISNEKQYRYLDEMLTRCMLQLDDIDIMGNVTVRLSRKAAVKQVQSAIDLLESKVSKVAAHLEVTENEHPEAVSTGENPEDCKDVEMKEDGVTASDSEACGGKLDVNNVPDMLCDLPGNELSNEIGAEESGSKNPFECVDVMSVSNSQSTTVTEVVADMEHSAEMDSEPVIEEPTEEEVGIVDLGNSNICEAEGNPPLIISDVQEMNNIANCEMEARNTSVETESKDTSAVSEPISKCEIELTADDETNVQNTSVSLTPSADNLDNCINDAQSCM